MEKFAYIKCVENKENIQIKHKLIEWLPRYFKDKYINKKIPYTISEVFFMEMLGFEVTLNVLQSEIKTEKSERIIESMLYDLYKRDVSVAFCDNGLGSMDSNIVFVEGENLISFFIDPVVKKALKYTGKDIQYVEIILIDNEDEYSTYNIVEALYNEVNYLTIFTNRSEYFEAYREKIYSDTGLNLQIIEQTKSSLKEADVIINLSSSSLTNYDYFYKKGAIYIEMSKNKNKTLELLRKRSDVNVIDDVLFSVDNKVIKNHKLEALLYLKNRTIRDYIHYNKYPKSQEVVNTIMKNEKLNIAGFYQYGNIIRQYKS